MGENIFSRFQTLLVLEIREQMLRNRRNDSKCLETGENVFSHFQTLLGLEIKEKVLEGWKVDRRKDRYRRNGRKCPEMGENSFSHLQTLSVFKVFFSFSWKAGRLEGQKEGWKVRRLEGSKVFVISPVSGHFQKILEGQNVRILSYFHQFLHNLTEPSAPGVRRGVRSVPVISVHSRAERRRREARREMCTTPGLVTTR